MPHRGRLRRGRRGLQPFRRARLRNGVRPLIRDPRERFTATAGDYARYRPAYPDALIDWIASTARPSRVVDVGCGTGISTRMFAARGFDVVGVDPNDAMLKIARAQGGAAYRKGEAASTGLPDRSVDLVAAGQAFHWFDLPAALMEFRRILEPDGWCAAFWNSRTAATPFLRDYEALLREYSAEYRELRRPADAVEAIRASPGVASIRRAEFDNGQRLGRAAFLGRVRSSSYVAHGVAKRREFEAALSALFDRYQAAGTVDFLYRAVGICWRLKAFSAAGIGRP